MATTITLFACSQCGCEAPIDPVALRAWTYGRLAMSHECDDAIDHLLLCPACVAEEHLHAFEEGEGD